MATFASGEHFPTLLPLGRGMLRPIVVISASSALLAGVIVEAMRRETYSERFLYHAQQLEGSSGPYGMFHQLPSSAQERQIRSWLYHAAMRQKYQDALTIPFRYVEPDPAEPD